MGKYAVVIGINYLNNPEAKRKHHFLYFHISFVLRLFHGSKLSLTLLYAYSFHFRVYPVEGCCNDARIIFGLLQRKGFDESDIVMLIDDDDNYKVPNHVNVKKALKWLCSDREEDDILFMHFSGHGTQLPADNDADDVEEDKLDEAIVLDQLFPMTDDDLKQYFSMVPSQTKVTVITDCCHSGTMLDGAEVIIEGPKDSSSAVSQQESEELLSILGGSRGAEVSTNRSLPIETICSVMSQKLGGADVPPTSSGLNGALTKVFGGTAGSLMFKYATKFIDKNGDGERGQMSGMLGGLLGALGGGGSGAPPQKADPISSLLGGGGGGGALGGMMSSFMGGGRPEPKPEPQEQDPMGQVMGLMNQFGFGGSEDIEGASSVPPYNPGPKQVSRDSVVLITGCQANETSADVRPANGEPHGALTKTLADIQAKDDNISYYDLVSHVRSSLSVAGFSQNPCLETCEARSTEPFIC